MASCDDDFGLLGDEAQSQQQQAFAHRFVQKSGGIAALQSRSGLNAIAPSPPPPASAPPNKGVGVGVGVGVGEGDYGSAEAFGQPPTSDARHHCFAEHTDADPFVPDDDDDEDTEAEAEAAATGGTNSERKSHHQPPKRRDRGEDFNDGDYCYISAGPKKGRTGSVSSSSGGDYRKDREEWSDSAISSLLDAYTERFEQLNRGNLRGRDWEDVASIVSERCSDRLHKAGGGGGKSVEQCKNKIDNLKKRYKVECQRLSSGGLSVSHWPWFKKMEQIVGNSSSSSSSKPTPDDDKSVAIARQQQQQQHNNKRYPLSGVGPLSAVTSSKIIPLAKPRWKRVLLKIGGTALAGAAPQNVDPKVIMLLAREIAAAKSRGVQVAVVVGGRNIFCGDSWAAATGTDRASTYQIGMMASVMNAVLLQASLEKVGVETRIQTALMMQEIAEPYIRSRAIRHLEKSRVVIFGGIGAGIGNPLFTTDTAAALRASEINADVVLKGTAADIVYGCPARTNSNAPFEHISFRELASRGFSAMDMTAITFCEENNIPVVLFNILEPGNVAKALCGDQVGTLVDQSGRIS